MRVVAALGGNALLRRGEPQTLERQWQNVKTAANALAGIVNAGHELIVTHGNGPQVGRLANQNYAYDSDNADSLDVLDAQTEGMIGYMIEQELHNAVGSDAAVATLLTRVEVDLSDPAFGNPKKPVGPVILKSQADLLSRERCWVYAPEGQGYRRLVPSPEPKTILCRRTIAALIDSGTIVICGGGGGIPVTRNEAGRWTGVEAVIDKDSTSALLAGSLAVDALLLLTDVDGVYDHFGTPDSKKLENIGLDEMERLKAQRVSMAGSMGPKIEAGMRFVKSTGARAIIGSLENAVAMLDGYAGTSLIRR